nr:ABC transporter ATP-binding protein [Mesorhizobium amorphae]
MTVSRRTGHAVAIQSLCKSFGAVRALDDVSLEIPAGEFISLLGPSGSGKSTLLMAVAGFVDCQEGRILVNGQDITRVPAERRSLGVVFQGYALFPHMTVAENVAYPLKLRGVSKSDIARRVDTVLDLVKLRGMGDRKPRQLSGGQQQRVALARAFVFEPGIVLLDEPLSALDKQLRSELQFELKGLHGRLGTTFINVTHDQEEAMAMSDRVAVLKDGTLMQVATPREIYELPNSRFVAEFVGHAAFLDGTVAATSEDRFVLESGQYQFPIPDTGRLRAGDEASLVLRPERLQLVDRSSPEVRPSIPGTIIGSAFLGPQCVHVVQTDFGALKVSMPSSGRSNGLDSQKDVAVVWEPDAAIVLPRYA